MKRLVDYYLNQWKNDPYRKPLLLRGARQIGKTFSVRKLGKSFPDFVEINLERLPDARIAFEGSLNPEKIIRDLAVIIGKEIKPGKTLLFFDEIQAVPQAIIALRYFYEEMPELHVIAAGSLLDFAIEKVGVPVGRIQSFYMFPLSFIEFLVAMGNRLIVQEILSHSIEAEMSPLVHNKLLSLLGEYLVFGGMPQAVKLWKETNNPLNCAKNHGDILDFYRQDFDKYAKSKQVKYVELIFEQVPIQLGKKFKYNVVEGDYRKRELAPALDLLTTAGVVHRVYNSSGQGIPLGAQVDLQDYKVIFLDVGLCQTALGLNVAGWLLQPLTEFINKGSLVEAFVGQEMLAYGNPHRKKQLFYWHREARTSQAEVDYLIQKNEAVIPVEVKSGSGRTLKSLQIFLETHQACSFGIRFSTQNYSEYQNVKSYPLYAIAQIISQGDVEMREALSFLVQDQ